MSLLNLFSNKLNHLINIHNKNNVIYYFSNKNVTNSGLLTRKRKRVISQTEIEKKTSESNKDTHYFEIKEEIKDANEHIFDISFFY